MEKQEQDLCTNCGLCCDGTLFPYMNVKEEEAHLFTPASVHVEQRCQHLSECSSCAIYKKRPHICKMYKCSILDALNKEKITFEEGIKLVEVVKNDKTNRNKIKGIMDNIEILQDFINLSQSSAI